jgi:hypothetical protein
MEGRMARTFTRSTVFATVIMLLLASVKPTSAAPIVVGTATGPSTAVPFGFIDFAIINTQNDISQQLYEGASFGAAPVLITSLTFFTDQTTALKGLMTYTNQELYLSTAATSVGSPADNFAGNRGADFTQVFAGTRQIGFEGFPIDPCATCTATELTFAITPFLYDPSQGDLLLEVRQQSVVYSADHLYFLAGVSPLVSSLEVGGLFHNEVVVNPRYGLLTQFDVQAVPEPATMMLVGAGLLLGARRVRAARR